MAANTTVDWERKVREFSQAHGYSVKDALEWLVQRDSLETILGLIGAEIVGDQCKLKPWLVDLGAWLKGQGYEVPPIYCPTNSYAFDSETRVGENVSITKKVSIRSSETSETPREYQSKVLFNLTLTEAVIKASINELVAASNEDHIRNGWDVADNIMGLLYKCKTDGFDVATALVNRLREVAG